MSGQSTGAMVLGSHAEEVREMPLLDYARFRATPVATDPFPHVVVANFLPPEALTRVVEGFPELAQRGSFPASSLRFGGDAAELMRELEGPLLRAEIAAKFGLDLKDAPTMLTVRGCTSERDGMIHRDSVAKLVTTLLYLNPANGAWTRHEGCLRLLRNDHDLEDFAVEVPPIDGTLLVFPNVETSWHGHKTFVGKRYSAQLNYMATEARTRSELRRHRFSAALKRLTRAA